MRKIILDEEQATLFQMALMKNLFPQPLKGEILYKNLKSNGGQELYFRDDFFNYFLNKIEIVNLNEDFIKSNAAQQWSEILLKIQNAFNANINIQEFEPYYIFTTLKERE